MQASSALKIICERTAAFASQSERIEQRATSKKIFDRKSGKYWHPWRLSGLFFLTIVFSETVSFR